MSGRSARTGVWIAAIALPLALLYASLFVGRFDVAPSQVGRVLLSLAWPGDHVAASIETIVLQIRLPRAVLALAVGAGLSVSGAAYQGFFRNPLVSPDVLGATAAAAFGAALAFLASWGPASVQLLAFAFGVGGVALTWGLASTYRTQSTLMLVLSGVIVAAFFTALLGAAKYMADPESRLPAITYWLLGSLNGASWTSLGYALPPLAVGTGLLLALGWQVNLLAMGEEEARALGARTTLVRVLVIVGTTLVGAAAVSACGIVGWIGLVVPHLARRIAGPDHRRLFPMAFAIGASYLLVMDALARTLTPGEIPIGILTALVGAPFGAWLLRRTRDAWR